MATDGIVGMFAGRLINKFAKSRLSGRQMGHVVSGLVRDCGNEPILRSGIVFGNHYTQRLNSDLSDSAERRLAQSIQFVLPGAPLLYYGIEVGMLGGNDPGQRAPMDRRQVAASQPDMAWLQRLVDRMRSNRALRIGDTRAFASEKLFAVI